MTRAKPRLNGENNTIFVDGFPPRLYIDLQEFADKQGLAHDFIKPAVGAAWFAKADRLSEEFRSTNKELKAEYASLLKTLSDAERKLRTMSHDFSRLHGKEANSRDCAQKLRQVIVHLVKAKHVIDALPRNKRLPQKNRERAIEFAYRLLPILHAHGISTAATASSDYKTDSAIVKILVLIGGNVGLVLAPTTWRDIVAEAKRADIYLGALAISGP